MTAVANVELIKELFTAFGRGDIDHVVNAHAHNVVMESPVSHTSNLPWAGRRNSRQELIEYFETMAAHVRPEAFHDIVFTASGDRVVVEGSNSGTVLSTGKRYDHDWVMVFTLRDAEVVAFRHFYDSTDIESAM
jgi:ketosteroid isomerase-like protein